MSVEIFLSGPSKSIRSPHMYDGSSQSHPKVHFS